MLVLEVLFTLITVYECQIVIHTISVINCILVCSLVHPSIYTLNSTTRLLSKAGTGEGGSQVLGGERDRVTEGQSD